MIGNMQAHLDGWQWPRRPRCKALRTRQTCGLALLCGQQGICGSAGRRRSEEHTSELQSLMRISYAVFCLKKKNNQLHLEIQDTTKQTTIKTIIASEIYY